MPLPPRPVPAAHVLYQPGSALLHGNRWRCHIGKSYCLDVEHLSQAAPPDRASTWADQYSHNCKAVGCRPRAGWRPAIYASLTTIISELLRLVLRFFGEPFGREFFVCRVPI